jgi:hypothetical protein
MFKQNDRTYTWIRKTVNVLTIVLMVVCLIAGIIVMASCNETRSITVPTNDWGGTTTEQISYFNTGKFFVGLLVFLLGPVVVNLLWLVADFGLNTLLDIKIIRNAVSGESVEEVAKLCKPIVIFKRKKEQKCVDKYENVLDKLLTYKKLLDENAITQEEYDSIKSKLMPAETENTTEKNEAKVFATIEKLKKLTDEGVISEEEFSNEKAKLLK